MSNADVTTMSDDDLVREFKYSAEARGKCYDVEVNNLGAGRRGAISAELARRGHDSLAKLFPLLDDAEAFVRLAAAAACMRIDPVRCKAIVYAIERDGKVRESVAAGSYLFATDPEYLKVLTERHKDDEKYGPTEDGWNS